MGKPQRTRLARERRREARAAATEFDRLLDEAYLLILTRRPQASELARALGVTTRVMGRVVCRLDGDVRVKGFLIGCIGTGGSRRFQIESLRGPKGTAIPLGPEALKVRRLPASSPGLKVDDEIVYARNW